MLFGNSRLFRYAVVAVVASFVLLLILLAVLVMWEGWFSKPLDGLPILFWVLYALWVGISVLLLIFVTLDGSPNKWNYTSRSIIGNMIVLLIGIVQAVHYSVMPTWTGGRLFWLTLSVFMVFEGAEGLIKFHIIKKLARV